MPEIRFTITKKLDDMILEVSDSMGIDKSDYIRSLIITDLRKKQAVKPIGTGGNNEGAE